MLDIIRDIYRQARESHRRLYDQSLTAGENLHMLPIEELTDIAFGLRESIELLEDARKALDKIKKRAEQFACMQCMQQSKGDKIQTPFCSAETKIKHFAVYPAKRWKDQEKFDEFMKLIGVPQYLYEKEIVRVNWEGMKNWCTELTKEGRPLPLDPDVTYTEFTLSMRRKSSTSIL